MKRLVTSRLRGIHGRVGDGSRLPGCGDPAQSPQLLGWHGAVFGRVRGPSWEGLPGSRCNIWAMFPCFPHLPVSSSFIQFLNFSFSWAVDCYPLEKKCGTTAGNNGVLPWKTKVELAQLINESGTNYNNPQADRIGKFESYSHFNDGFLTLPWSIYLFFFYLRMVFMFLFFVESL